MTCASSKSSQDQAFHGEGESFEQAVDVQESLLRAIYEKRTALIEKLLRCGADASAPDRSGQTPLHWAARRGHEEAARILIKCRASLTASSRDGSTPLHLAAEADSAALVRFLLQQRADAYAKSKTGRTPLHCAAEHGSCTAISALLDHVPKDTLSAALGAVDHRGDAPLLHATARGHADAVRVLLAAGADPHCSSRRGDAALRQAVDKGHSEVAAALLEGGSTLSALGESGESPLFDVVRRGDARTAEVLISHGVDASSRDERGCTALHVAAQQNRPAVIASLLRLGADANSRNEDARTPLFLAGEHGHAAVAEALLIGGANPWAVDGSGQTSLHVAAAGSHLDVMSTLITNSANVHAVDSEGRTPVVLAVAGGHDDAVRSLLRCGASLPKEVKKTPVLFAILKEVAAELKEKEEVIQAPVRRQSIRAGATSCLKTSAAELKDKEEVVQALVIPNCASQAAAVSSSRSNDLTVSHKEVRSSESAHTVLSSKLVASRTKVACESDIERPFLHNDDDYGSDSLDDKRDSSSISSPASSKVLIVESLRVPDDSPRILETEGSQGENCLTEELGQQSDEDVENEVQKSSRRPFTEDLFARLTKAGRLGSTPTPNEMEANPDSQKNDLDDMRKLFPLLAKSQVPDSSDSVHCDSSSIHDGVASEVASSSAPPSARSVPLSDRRAQEEAALRKREDILDPFFELLRSQGDGIIAVAWRRYFDTNGDAEVSFQEFCTGLAKVGYHEDALKLWQVLEPQSSNHLAVRCVDPESAKLTAEFEEWCARSHGGPVEVFAAINVSASIFLSSDELLAGLRKLGYFNAKDLPEHLSCEEQFLKHMYPLIDPWGKGMVSEDSFLFLERDGPKKRSLMRKFARASRYLAQGEPSTSSSANNLLSDLSKRSKWAAKNGHNVDIYLEPVPEKLSVPIHQHREKQKSRLRRHGPRSSSTPDLARNPPPASADAANAAAQVMAEVTRKLPPSLSLPRLPAAGMRRHAHNGTGSRGGSEVTSCRSSIAASSVAATRQGAKRLYKRCLAEQLPAVNSHHRDARFARGIAMPGVGGHQSQVDLALNPQRCEEFLSQHCEKKLFEHYYKFAT